MKMKIWSFFDVPEKSVHASSQCCADTRTTEGHKNVLDSVLDRNIGAPIFDFLI